MNKNLTQKTFNAFYWSIGGTIFKMITQLGVLAILARLISKADFGVLQTSVIVIGFAELIGQMGVGPALIQRKNLTELHIRTGTTMMLLFSFILYGLVTLSSGFIAEFFRMPELNEVLKIVAYLFILEGLTVVSQSLLLREMKQKIIAQIDFITYLIGYAPVAIILAYKGYGLWALVSGQVAQSILKCFFSYIKSRHSLIPYVGKKEIKELLYFGGGFTIAKFFNYLANQGANIVAGRYLGAVAIGVYGRAQSIMNRPVNIIGTSMDRALFPALAARQDRPDILIKGFYKSTAMVVFLSLPISIMIIFSAKEIINILLGENWKEVIIPLQILTSGLVFRIGYKVGDSLCRATGHVYSRAKRQFIYGICVVIGCYIGSFWGITGISFGYLFAIMINFILMTHLSLIILKIKWIDFLKEFLSEFVIPIFLGLIFILVYYLFSSLISYDILLLAISYSIYGLIILLLFYNYSYKLSFLDILPFKKLINRLTKQ